MGLAFLPWEKLPAYLFGPLLIIVSITLLVLDASWPPTLPWLLLIPGEGFGIWIIWQRYKTGEEPLWSEERRAAKRVEK
jgi:hypothetical protein